MVTVLQQAVLDGEIILGPLPYLEAMKEEALLQIAERGFAEIDMGGIKVKVDYR